MEIADIFHTTEPFERYGTEYFLVLTFYVLAGSLLIYLGRNVNELKKIRILKSIGFILSAIIVSWIITESLLGRFNYKNDLPIIFCNFTALVIPFYFIYRKQVTFDMLYYIIFAGAIQAIITPGLKFNFPHYEFLKFWTVHVGLIIFILYEMIVFKKLPSRKGIFTSFLTVQLYVIVVFILNSIINTNYLYLNTPPDNGTLLDALGGWPYYIIWMDLILIPYFILLYLPIFLIKRKSKQLS
ncbi:TIGR02206 family membrane protein [Marivirga atlantica]|jgi:hypothetical integral membrane protein (TIGR02206 family)|uniref:TIGR02206 family membrane protein n=1 Tax=Marivirga atlantica TaxID=1548457 RepID=A0A937DF97_9BACT|nr:TIGR02206 family membrane protein [Marivirga atlantica]MBL0766007.1 TIGR02206 family membrane protein [Marivirga atlantica]